MTSFDYASYLLSKEIETARITKDRNHIRRLRRLWQKNAFGQGSKHGEKWKVIIKKVETEGSTWYVWWADGVRKYAQRYL